jgi:calcium/calmodulin-dependent protein kinase I
MRVTVSDTTELGADPETGSTHTLFVIHISEDDGREYDVRRRFSHFVELREELIRTGCAIVEDLEFPSRKLWGSSSQETVRERQQLLGKWLQRAAAVYGASSSALSQFLQPSTGKKAGAVRFNMEVVLNSSPYEEVYQQGDELGRGAFSIVYLTTRRDTGQKFACKVVDMQSPQYQPDEMETEIRIAKLVSGHANTVNVIDVFRDDRYWRIVQELVMGGELFELVLQRADAKEMAGDADLRPYSEREASLIICQAVAGVAHCHAKGVVHCDLKPENLLCESDDPDSVIKLGDFGLSQILPADGGMLTASSGTPEYVAPEVVTRPPQGYDQSCDIWSIGVITYILLSGFPPFYAADPDPRQNTRMILQQVKTKVIEDSQAFFPEPEWTSISSEAKALVLSMLDRDPSRRPTAEELLQHPWMANNTHTDALPTIARLRKFNAKRKLRAAYFALKATNRMAALIQSMKATRLAVKFAQNYSLEHVENLYDAFDDVAHRKGPGTKTLHESDFVAVLTDILKLQTEEESAMASAHWEAFAVVPMAAPAISASGVGGGAAAAEAAAVMSASINYQEYILALSTMFARSPDERLKFAFEIVDADGSGQIEKVEFCDLIEALLARTQSHYDMAQIREISAREFAAADADNDGCLSISEFVAASQSTPMLSRYFETLDRLCKTL